MCDHSDKNSQADNFLDPVLSTNYNHTRMSQIRSNYDKSRFKVWWPTSLELSLLIAMI